MDPDAVTEEERKWTSGRGGAGFTDECVFCKTRSVPRTW